MTARVLSKENCNTREQGRSLSASTNGRLNRGIEFSWRMSPLWLWRIRSPMSPAGSRELTQHQLRARLGPVPQQDKSPLSTEGSGLGMERSPVQLSSIQPTPVPADDSRIVETLQRLCLHHQRLTREIRRLTRAVNRLHPSIVNDLEIIQTRVGMDLQQGMQEMHPSILEAFGRQLNAQSPHRSSHQPDTP